MKLTSMSSRYAFVACAGLAACAGSAFGQAANDSCAGAIAITVPTTGTATYNGTTVAATNNGTASCASSAASPDVWYTYTHPSNGGNRTLTLTTAGGQTNYDTALAVRTACGTGGTELACDDDGGGNLTSLVSISVTPGTTYYIRVSGYNNITGLFTLSASLQSTSTGILGPDVIVGDLSDGSYWGTGSGVYAYSIGTTSCNIGDVDVLWQAANNLHPVIGQNIYRIENNRMELIGFSWLKHGFTALTQNLCATCNGHGGPVLGVGCSDPYVASLNGDQTRLGPRSHINAATGYYPYPFNTPPAPYVTPPTAAATIGRRLQVATTEIGHAGATYVGECQYVTADDASFITAASGRASNGVNNLSYRLVTPTASALNMNATTVRMLPALKAWQAIDPTVVCTSFDYQEGVITCRYWVAAKVVNNNNGTWTYNYTVMNVNSDRSAASFSVPASNVTTSNFFQRTPTYHSGEPTSMNNPWTRTVSTSAVTWATPDTYSVASPWGSALRWSTAATFSLTANTAPTTGACTLSFFKPGNSGEPATLSLAGLPVPAAGHCAGDFNNDGGVDFFDYLDFVDAFSTNAANADFNNDGSIDFFDYLDFVDAFTLGC